MKILLLATRSLHGPTTGRKMVLRTIRDSCRALGHEVQVAVVGGGGRPRGDDEAHVPGPGLVRLLLNLGVECGLRGRSLNECLYWSPAAQRAVARRVADGGFDLVIADMLRTAPLCVGLPVPWVLDLDDLLSQRYAQMAASSARGGGPARSVLGYFAERLPAVVRGPAERVAARLLAWEARRIAGRERHFAEQADAVTLVSPAEARHLAGVLRRPVFDAPMAITMPSAAMAAAACPATDAVVFIGSLDYGPNRDALVHHVEAIEPLLRRSGTPLRLDVIGHASAALRVPSDGVRYLGYVDELAATLARYRVFAAPIVSGTGIKTKVIDAMANGLAVVATPAAVAGLAIEPGRQAIVAETPETFAAALRQLQADPALATRIGGEARAFARQHFSPGVLQARWQAILARACQAPDRRPAAATVTSPAPAPATIGTPGARQRSSP